MFEPGYGLKGRLVNFAYKAGVFSVIGMFAGAARPAHRAAAAAAAGVDEAAHAGAPGLGAAGGTALAGRRARVVGARL
jgi:hypothetical protein